MEVTGWTYFEDHHYIDINHEGMKIRGAAMKKAPKIPSKEEYLQMSEDEASSFFKKRDELIEKLLDVPEVHEVNNLCEECYKAVVKCVRENNFHFTGDAHQNCDFGTPIIDDKYIFCLSQRSWGGLIADAFPDEIDDSEGYGYLKWAWTPAGEIKMPK